MNFKGTLEDLKARLAESGIVGDWRDNGNGHQLRLPDGAILNFYPSTGTVHCQGRQPAQAQLESQVRVALDTTVPIQTPKPAASEDEGRIFVVHGHDSAARDQLELCLRRLGLEPFILMNSSGGGLTIIEALEGHIGRDYSSSFGIVLMTPDDMGYSQRDGADKVEPRARQNVILEAGMLIASLTRTRMALLVKGHLEIPSDLQGVIYFGFNEHVREVLPKLVNRLREAGINVDERKLAGAMA
jgi:predicted nucleotide-binding protein